VQRLGATAPSCPPGRTHGTEPNNPRNHVEWNLLINTRVEIRHNGRVIRTGTVEHAMPDSSARWIAADGNGPRQMFEMAQGHQMRVTLQDLSG
jgi:hypothetical protein